MAGRCGGVKERALSETQGKCSLSLFGRERERRRTDALHALGMTLFGVAEEERGEVGGGEAVEVGGDGEL